MGVDPDAIGTHEMSEILEFCLEKRTFTELAIQAVRAYAVKRSAQVFQMFFLRFFLNQVVVQVDQCVRAVTENCIHDALKRRWSIGEPETQNLKFEVSFKRVKRRFWDIPVRDTDLMVPL